MVDLFEAGGDALDKVLSGLGQSYAARIALEQEGAKVFLQRFHARPLKTAKRHALKLQSTSENPASASH